MSLFGFYAKKVEQNQASRWLSSPGNKITFLGNPNLFSFVIRAELSARFHEDLSPNIRLQSSLKLQIFREILRRCIPAFLSAISLILQDIP